MLLLGVGRHLGAELAHHGLGARGSGTAQQCGRTGESAGGDAIVVGVRGRAVISDRRVHGRHRSAVVRVVAARGDRRAGRVGGRETVRVARAPGVARTVDVAGSEILAESDHAATGIQSIAKSGSGVLRLTNARVTVRELACVRRGDSENRGTYA